MVCHGHGFERQPVIRLLRAFALVLLLLPVVLLFVSFFLPVRYRVVRDEPMRTTADAVFAQINSPKTWAAWTAWGQAHDPDMQVSFSGPDSGVGASYRWAGPTVGEGVLTITRSDPGKGISYDLAFENGKFRSVGSITIRTAGDHLNVSWSNEGDLGSNPIARYFGLLMDRRLGPDLERGLGTLRRTLERMPK